MPPTSKRAAGLAAALALVVLSACPAADAPAGGGRAPARAAGSGTPAAEASGTNALPAQGAPRTAPVDAPMPEGPLQRLAWSDFTYVGSFTCPRNREWAFLDYAGLAYVPTRGTLIVNSRKGLVELSIPPLVMAENDDQQRELEAAEPLSPPVSLGRTFQEMLPYKGRRLGGLAWHDGRLWIGMFEFYNVASRDNLGIVSLSDRLDDPRGAWRVGPENVNRPTKNTFHANKAHGYVCAVPPSWSAAYAPGKTMASGRHRGAGAFGGAQGPALFAWEPNPDTPPGGDLHGVPLMIYPTKGGRWPEYRNKDSFVATWVWSDKGQAVVIGCTKGLGPNHYGPGPSDCYPSKGWHANPYEPRVYLMDPVDLGGVAVGRLRPDDPLPYETVVPEFPWRTPAKGENPDCRHPWFAAMTYDPQGRRLFVLQARAYVAGEYNGTVIHVLHVSDG
jgi:hypothetical protein